MKKKLSAASLVQPHVARGISYDEWCEQEGIRNYEKHPMTKLEIANDRIKRAIAILNGEDD